MFHLEAASQVPRNEPVCFRRPWLDRIRESLLRVHRLGRPSHDLQGFVPAVASFALQWPSVRGSSSRRRRLLSPSGLPPAISQSRYACECSSPIASIHLRALTLNISELQARSAGRPFRPDSWISNACAGLRSSSAPSDFPLPSDVQCYGNGSSASSSMQLSSC